VTDHLIRGRECYGRRAWADAFRALSLADQAGPLAGADLEQLAVSAYLVGRDDDYLATLERAHRAHLGAGEGLRAARAAFWLGLRLLFRGETGPATGWFARAQRVLEREDRDCVERGYLLLPAVQEQLRSGDCAAACATAASAAEIGDRFAEADLSACARHLQGRGLLLQGDLTPGLALLDEAMVSVIAGELSPIVTGLIYCSVIEGCLEVYELRRAREWTWALARWCEDQPELVAFTGVCMAHRAEIMLLNGAWSAAIDEAKCACARCLGAGNRQAAAAAFYQQAEVQRLQGEFGAAEESYRSASQWGWEPQPGLALLRLAQGRVDPALAAIRRVVNATTDRVERAKLLPASIEIMLAAGDIEEARRECRELEGIARALETGEPGILGAMAAQARGEVELAAGEAMAALVSLRCAWRAWLQIDAPYLAARVRVLVALACRALDDEDGSNLELQAAHTVFEQLGAAPDLARVASLTRSTPARAPHRLSSRELQVLRLVAAGKTNKAIAAELHVSERTIDRHVSNIFSKLDVPSRAAATAFACQHHLV